MLQATAEVFERLGDVHSRTVTMGQVADILAGRGETEEALRIRREGQLRCSSGLPVFERLGDVRERAVTLYKIGMALLTSDDLVKDAHSAQAASEALNEAHTAFVGLQNPEG